MTVAVPLTCVLEFVSRLNESIYFLCKFVVHVKLNLVKRQIVAHLSVKFLLTNMNPFWEANK